MANIVERVVELSGGPGTTDGNGNDFDLLRDAVIASNLAGTLSSSEINVTVFAPNDAAFMKLANDLGFSGTSEAEAFGFIVDALTLLGEGDFLPLLQSVLTYHVLPDEVFSADVVALDDGTEVTTLQGGTITLDTANLTLGDNEPALDDPALIGFDVDVDNGVIHVLDGVLLPVPVSEILSQPGTDFIIGDGSDDAIATQGGKDFIDGNAGDDEIFAGWGADVAIGGAGDDSVYGGNGNDTVIGESGDDRLFGGSGKDDISGGTGNDIAFGGSGNDMIDGGSKRDNLYGGKGSDTIDGGDGWDNIFGGAGDDVIEGGVGRDQMIGGGGNDTFIFNDGSGDDIIAAFEQGSDLLDVSGYGITSFSELEDISSGFFSTTITLDDDASITLLGTFKFEVDASDFIFA